MGNPVAVSTGSKLQDGPEDLDFTLPGILPIVWARRYNSLDRRDNGLFGVGWSVFYEVEILRVPHPDGGDLWVYVNAEGERLELGQLKPGNRFINTLDGLAFFEMGNGLTVVEDIHDGLYQVFEMPLGGPTLSVYVDAVMPPQKNTWTELEITSCAIIQARLIPQAAGIR